MVHNQETSKIIGIQFGILSAEEIRRTSIGPINDRDTFIGNKPVNGGLFDSRMGVLESGQICPTDGYTYIHTPGYFGHIELARPVFSIQNMKDILDSPLILREIDLQLVLTERIPKPQIRLELLIFTK